MGITSMFPECSWGPMGISVIYFQLYSDLLIEVLPQILKFLINIFIHDNDANQYKHIY